MKKLKISIISIILNFILAGGKTIIGILSSSAGLLADGIHSGLDVFSSIITYYGIKIASKKANKKYPYGHYTAEILAGLAVSLLLAISGIWIAYDGLEAILGKSSVVLNFWGYLIVIFSIIANEFIARYKFKIGAQESSLALIADGQHSRADAISSVGVLLGLLLVDYFPMADGLIAILIGLYILYESWDMGKETIDQLMGISDAQLEQEIKQILRKENVILSKIKTRQIGSASFAEITIQLKADLTVDKAEQITKYIEQKLLEKIPRLTQITISVESHQYQQCFVRTKLGQKIKWRKNYKLPGAPYKKQNIYRIIIPIENNAISKELGAPQYLLVDKNKEGVVLKKTVKNPYYTQTNGYGMRFAKAVQANEIITAHIGEKAQKLAEELNIKITMVDKNFDYQNYDY